MKNLSNSEKILKKIVKSSILIILDIMKFLSNQFLGVKISAKILR